MRCPTCGSDLVAAMTARRKKTDRIALCCRLWSKVEIRGPEECWPWTGKWRHPFGYGWISEPGKDGRPINSHRVAFRLATGLDPVGWTIMHTCDRPGCCNPRHLRASSQQENMRDMDAKGRRRTRALPGERNPFAKLTEEKVREIRRLYVRGVTSQRQVAELVGTTRATVCEVVTGRRWRHVA